MFGNRPVKLACKGLVSYIYMARRPHKQKESCKAAVLRKRALNSYKNRIEVPWRMLRQSTSILLKTRRFSAYHRDSLNFAVK